MYTAQHHQLFSSFKQLKINKILALVILLLIDLLLMNDKNTKASRHYTLASFIQSLSTSRVSILITLEVILIKQLILTANIIL